MEEDRETFAQQPEPQAKQATEVPSGPRLQVDAIESFNYAAWQNDVPLLRRVVIDNTGGEELSSLSVELKATPSFVQEQRWTIDRLRAGEQLSLRDVELQIDPAYLDRLDEAVRGVLSFQLIHKGEIRAAASHVLRVLARDEWGGMGDTGELLAAFVTPNDPAIPSLLRTASSVLEQYGHAVALDGYQSNDPNRAYMLAAALWSAVAGCSLVYANPPGSFEKFGQKIRRVGTILHDRLATCLDSTLLFASGLEAMGLNPILVMVQGHCFVGVWLVEKAFKQLVETDCSELRKAIAAKELIVFETTLITHRPPSRFPDAITTANGSLAEGKEAEFVGAIDIARARMAQFRPLASHRSRQEAEEVAPESGPLPLPAMPGLDARPVRVTDERPRTPSGRIERWQRKLLDLSLRNRLLNFSSSKQTVSVICHNISQLEDRLAEGARLRLIPLADNNPQGSRDAELHQKRTQRDLDLEFSRQALQRNELVSPLERKELDGRLTSLFRMVQNDMAEGGANTLYLAVGFLRWKVKPTDEKAYRAPLLLVPVTLTRRSASSPFYLGSHEDEVRFNATLLQMLKKDFDCDLTQFESQLPMDDAGVDVPAVLNQMREAVREIPGFEVVEETAIAPFSFVKYLMWKDLVDRVDQLQSNRVVRHLIQEPDKAFPSAGLGPMPRAEELDRRYLPADIVHPLPADSSQLAAVMAASEGHDLVIVGPPGTGKSQTIANLIAQCLSVGKTVLFVAEKTAALDVVYRRLREHGLGDCCVELHSNKAERRRFLDQLDTSWKKRGADDASSWESVCDKLRIRRDQLNAYVEALHTPAENGWTAYRAMGESARGRDVQAPRLTWPKTVRHDQHAYRQLETTLSELATTFSVVSTEPVIPCLASVEWSMAWEQAFLESCQQLKAVSQSLLSSLASLARMWGSEQLEQVSSNDLRQLYRLAFELSRSDQPPASILLHPRLDELQSALALRRQLKRELEQLETTLEGELAAFCTTLGITLAEVRARDGMRSLYRLVKELLRLETPSAELVFHPRFDTLRQLLVDRSALLQQREQTVASLEARQFNSLLLARVDVARLRRDWQAALQSFWPFSIWKQSALAKQLKAFMKPGAAAQPAVDIPLLEEYAADCERLAENQAQLSLPVPLQASVEAHPHALEAHLEVAQQYRTAFAQSGFSLERIKQAVQGNLLRVTEAARRLVQPSVKIDTMRARLKENLERMELSAELRGDVERDADRLDRAVQAAGAIQGAAVDWWGSRERSLALLEIVLKTPESTRRELANEYCQLAKAFQTAWQTYLDLAKVRPVAKNSVHVVADAAAQAERVLANRTSLRKWITWLTVKEQAEQRGLAPFVEALQAGTIQAADVAARFRLAYARWWLPIVVDEHEPLRKFQRFLHEEAIEDFRRLDEAARRAAAPRARRAILHGLPPSDEVPRKSELGLLRHQVSLKRPSKSIREMITSMPETFGKLAPCLMMSPLSIAQYLPPSQGQFDVVVFDEASQIATWDAIGAIARGKQTIIVGDPKQLPPTNFFGRADGDEEDADVDEHERDLESILDEVQAAGLPTRQLNWHYRSRHESLISFSNFFYYGNQLVTFPAAESTDRGVSFRHVQDGCYDRGKSRSNRREAEEIVSDLVQRMSRDLGKPERQRLTFGVVTFNMQQQELIQDFLDDAQREETALEWFFAEERIEPTMVKNLENVQGDERDVMLFSITFGFDAAGKFPIDFGSINRSGGERRLNVAITRAKRELVVFASFLPEQLRAERSAARGVQDLKAFLEYAVKGPKALLSRVESLSDGHDSPLEEAIATALERRGWRVDAQVGVSGFRIDLGIVHPDLPGAYLAGIECDGATYHRSAAARDRDKTRQQVLENLGWSIERVWSTDWWYDPESAIERVDVRLRELLERSRLEQAKNNSTPAVQEAVASTAMASDLPDLAAASSLPDTADVVATVKPEVDSLRHAVVEAKMEFADELTEKPAAEPGEQSAAESADNAAVGVARAADLETGLSSVAKQNADASAETGITEMPAAVVERSGKSLEIESVQPGSEAVASSESIADSETIVNGEPIANSEPRSSSEPISIAEPQWESVRAVADPEPLVAQAKVEPAERSGRELTGGSGNEFVGQQMAHPSLIASSTAATERRFYGRIDLTGARENQGRFFDDDYSDILRQMALSVIESHGPIRDDVLARELARAHGFARTSSRIRQRVLELLPSAKFSEESTGRFFWAEPGPLPVIPFRYAANEEERRTLDEIAIAELIGLVRACPGLKNSDDPALVLAREIGLARLSRGARERLELALERHGDLT